MKVSNSINSLSSYPILNNYRRDYLNASFTANLDDPIDEFGRLTFKLDFDLTGAVEIKELISTGKASYYIHIECTYTSFRKCYKSSMPMFEIKIPSEELSDRVEISTFIIANDDIKEFRSECFNPNYGSLKFDISKYQILAIGNNYEVQIERDDNQLDSSNSIIKYTQLDNPNSEMKVMMDNSDYILVGLDAETYSRVNMLGKNTMPMTILSLIVIPTMIIVLETMKVAHEDYKEYHWYQVIDALLKQNNYDINTLEIQSEEFFKVIQLIFKNPIVSAIEELDEFADRMMQ